MNLENNGVGDGLEALASAAASTDEPTPQEPAKAEPAPAEQTPTEEVVETPPQEDELDLLKRVIATNPEMRDIYLAEKYGVPMPQAPAPQQQQPALQQQYQHHQPEPVAAELPFALDDYDPTNAEHQMAMFGHIIQSMVMPQLVPALQYVQQLQQQDQISAQQYTEQQYYQEAEKANDSISELFDKEIPGFKDAYQAYRSDTATMEQIAFGTLAEKLFTDKLREKLGGLDADTARKLQLNPKIHQEVAAQIAPKLKALAPKFGLTPAQAANPVNQAKAREAFTEPSNAVPASTTNPFNAAYEKGDVYGMVRALSS